jgi:hypothetical protein
MAPQAPQVEKLCGQVSGWPGVSLHSHRFGGTEFRFGSAEVGHVHRGGIVDIPFPRSIHDALLAEGLAEEHRWVPNSGWITFHMRNEEDLSHALWLMRLSFLRYALKTSADPEKLFQEASNDLKLTPHFALLLMQFLPREVTSAWTEPISA